MAFALTNEFAASVQILIKPLVLLHIKSWRCFSNPIKR